MSVTTLTAQELNNRRLQQSDLVVMDVRLPEEHESHAIEGSVGNCVFEVAFHERLAGLLPTKDTPVCVYGESGDSHEAEVAAEKLTRAGYTQVYRLSGCLAGWCEEDLPVEGTGELPPAAVIPEGRLMLDVAESRVQWTGRNLLNQHTGGIPVKSGFLDVRGEAITGGEIVLDLTGIHCDDLAGSPYHDVLIAHLRSDDFFDAERHPEARLKILQGKRVEGAPAGSQNLQVKAELTLRGITAPVDFTASAGVDDQGRAAAQAAFSIDRTRWGVLYGSGGFFKRLAGHLVNDLIDLQVRVVTVAAGEKESGDKLA